MGDFSKIKKICGFYISNVHLAMMILPYINKEIKNNKQIITFLEDKIEEDVQKILNKLIITDEEKNNIENINWSESNIYKYENVEKILKNKIIDGSIDIFICGTERYVEVANENIKKYTIRNKEKLKNINITIIDCFVVNKSNKNIRNILENHDMFFNTSGEQEIQDVFKEYYKKTI